MDMPYFFKNMVHFLSTEKRDIWKKWKGLEDCKKSDSRKNYILQSHYLWATSGKKEGLHWVTFNT